MDKFIFTTNVTTRIVTVGMTAYFLIFGGAVAEAHEVEVAEAESVVVCPVAPDVVVGKTLEISLRFQRLAAKWHEERGATSSITKMAQCDSYVSIIAMGKPVIPLIMAQLRVEGDKPDQWFWALQVLTEDLDPVSEDDRGDMRAMASAWLQWWKENPDYVG